MSSSLVDALLRDNLLEGIANSEVYVALRSDLKNDPNRFGAGTAEDPYDCSKTSGGYYKFDKIMRDFVVANSTIHLAPGIIPTEGYKDDPARGWEAKSGCRIIGGGWGADIDSNPQGNTVLLLEGHEVGENYAIGMGSGALTAFELVYLSINSGLSAADSQGTKASAVYLNGSHIQIRNVRFFNFGSKDDAGIPVTVVNLCNPAAMTTVYNNVMSDCIFESPSEVCENAEVTCVSVSAATGGTAFHYASVIRNCFFDCSGTVVSASFYAISATGGTGTIIEQNQILNCNAGFYIFNGAATSLPATRDIIVRDNFLNNVLNGFYLNLSSNPSPPSPIGRLVFQSNRVELPTSGSATGFKIASSSVSKSNPIVGQLIIRNNEFRHVDGAAGSSATIGITLECVAQSIVEENLISIGTDPSSPDTTKAIVRTSTVTTMKTFNRGCSESFLKWL